jgi:hypothetical protein
MDMLPMRQARTLRRRLSVEDEEQGQQQTLSEDREQALIKE